MQYAKSDFSYHFLIDNTNRPRSYWVSRSSRASRTMRDPYGQHDPGAGKESAPGLLMMKSHREAWGRTAESARTARRRTQRAVYACRGGSAWISRTWPSLVQRPRSPPGSARLTRPALRAGPAARPAPPFHLFAARVVGAFLEQEADRRAARPGERRLDLDAGGRCVGFSGRSEGLDLQHRRLLRADNFHLAL